MAWQLLADEIAAGRRAILPDEVPAWLDLRDWHGWPVLSIDDAASEVHIVAIWSARPGAFTRLVAGIVAAGFGPVVVCPFPPMQAILGRWGWRNETLGEGWTALDLWRPGPLGWRGGLLPIDAKRLARGHNVL